MRILNVTEHGRPEGAVYVGRPSRWGNPYRTRIKGAHPDDARAVAIDGYRLHLNRLCASGDVTRLDLLDLVGKDLVCWCSPKPCHAEVIRAMVGRARDDYPLHLVRDEWRPL